MPAVVNGTRKYDFGFGWRYNFKGGFETSRLFDLRLQVQSGQGEDKQPQTDFLHTFIV
jgi:hypothetical protein